MPPVTRKTTRKFDPSLKPGCRVYAPCEGSPGLYPGKLTADVNNLCTVIFEDYVGTICHNIPKQRVLINNDPKVSSAKARNLFDNPTKTTDKSTATHSVKCGSCEQPVSIMHAECRECEQICHATCFDTRLYKYSNVPVCKSCLRESTQGQYFTDSSADDDNLSNHSHESSNRIINNDIDNPDTDQESLQTQWPEAAVATVSKDEDDSAIK